MRISVRWLLSLAVVLGLALLVDATVALGEQKMSMDQYRAELAQWQKREADAKAAIAAREKEIQALKEQIDKADADLAACWDDVYALLGVDKAAVDAYRASLKAIEAQVNGLAALSPEELFKKKAEIAALKAQLAEKKKSPIYALTEMRELVAAIEAKIADLEARMPKAVYDSYVVVKGDYLWKISGKKEIYGDPYQWMKIYSVNRDLIKDPDLIYPDWVLKILRGCGPDQYIVVKGDFLRKIAQDPSVLNDPAAWTKIYEANKSVIGDNPNLIYPHTVLVIPK
ncbi:MAG: LysM peptidoglycan-binding domain-containing protein [candidate division KSB1 bacterium]|nr:LysM peptidoglycan-binding domain-containing protein [candidate division KSB1 bacterium]MDZ7294855.1 LysM peptidoglycan-binding domain-containing protein [candidate division KSB1 bacterium]MDZ7378083.1 LysM peptidoglycan-binding domain-containing protein [candidate division KSB1 bacterium]MDZ7384929.1 LysM peptidoglycan-binding domain-containing protein [candidate division KSB1 bacterium]MDZ7391983.1 LysM peptidoglycan-binding domain-containing protein [candidate division KSB1 bacterium]